MAICVKVWIPNMRVCPFGFSVHLPPVGWWFLIYPQQYKSQGFNSKSNPSQSEGRRMLLHAANLLFTAVFVCFGSSGRGLVAKASTVERPPKQRCKAARRIDGCPDKTISSNSVEFYLFRLKYMRDRLTRSQGLKRDLALQGAAHR